MTAIRSTTTEDQRAQVPSVIDVRDMNKTFRRTGGEEVHAVDKVSLTVGHGEMVVLLGPSGCGKTTLLRCIGGLEQPDSGECLIDGTAMSGLGIRTVPPESRNIGMMFQSYALWPHMTVAENVGYPLAARRVRRPEINRRVREMLRIVGIESLVDQHPGRLSGGQQQRVALARCLVAEPRVVLFDEPLSNVDAKVRVQLRQEIVEMQHRLGFAGIYVTHDQEEAMQLADRLAVMRDGKIAQLGSPREVYRTPDTNYVAEFVGAVNRWSARPASDPSRADTFEIEGLGDVVVSERNVVEVPPSGRVLVLARPEAVTMAETEDGRTPNRWAGQVVRQSFSGAHTEYVVTLDGGGQIRVSSVEIEGSGIREGTRVWVSIDPDRLRVLADEAAV